MSQCMGQCMGWCCAAWGGAWVVDDVMMCFFLINADGCYGCYERSSSYNIIIIMI